MDYVLYAQMRDKRMITIGVWKDMDFLESLLNNFEESDNIERFIIGYNGKVVSDKILKPKTKVLVRRKEDEGIHKRR